MSIDLTDERREARLRRMAQQQGYRLEKSRTRNPELLAYGTYRIVEPNRNLLVAGDPNLGSFGLSLDDVEEWLTSDDG